MLSLGACKSKEKEAAAATAPTVVTVGAENVAIVKKDTLRTGPGISGSLTAEKEAQLRSEVSGNIVQTYADQGQRVSTGMTLARVDAAALNDAYLAARSALTSARASADLATRELQRAKTLGAAGAIADRDVENAVRANTQAQAALADAQARVSAAKKNLDNATVRAPFNGVVSDRAVNAGDVVSPGTLLYTVIDPTSMRLEASVPAEQLSAVRLGAPVTFTVNGYPGRTFVGKITRVNPVADPATRQVRIIATVPNERATLVGGLFAEGRVASDVRVALVVPATAIDQRGVSPTALRLKDGRAERVTVQLGLRDLATETYEVVAGLAPGDTVLIGAAQGISTGTPVRVSAPNDTKAVGVRQ
jgi:RND family efflux transporter MFP subunit